VQTIADRRGRAILPLVVLLTVVTGLGSSGVVLAEGAVPRVGSEPGSLAATVPDTLPDANVYIPDDRDLSDCLSSLPKPECGSEDRGGAAQLITFGVLMVGMAFIGWRIYLGVRRRDRSSTP
jgi:hypothetical protein